MPSDSHMKLIYSDYLIPFWDVYIVALALNHYHQAVVQGRWLENGCNHISRAFWVIGASIFQKRDWNY